MQKDFTLPSGAIHHVTAAPFANAYALAKALLKAAKGLPLADNFLDLDIAALKDALIEAATSPDVEGALFDCLARTTYNDLVVNKGLFDDPKLGDQARKDFYSMARNVIEIDASPFFEQALSSLKTLQKKPSESPKQS